MRLLIFGGTFNPPHYGHLKMAQLVQAEFHYNKIVFIPSYIPAHKQVDLSVTPLQRLKMTQLASELIPDSFVSDCEIARKGVSYSYDTVQYLKKKYALTEKPGLVIGDDLVEGFSNWCKADKLAEEVDLIVCHRGDYNEKSFSYPHKYISNLQVDLSSSMIREALLKGEYTDVKEWVPLNVYNYIQKEKLFL